MTDPHTISTHTILCDLGGTHARFAQKRKKGFEAPMTVKAADFPTLSEALDHYCDQNNLSAPGKIAIATAAVPGEDKIWRFHNDNRWTIDPAALTQEGWALPTIVNDFVATARAIPALPDTALRSLRPGHPQGDQPRAVLGPGTGLGLAYLTPLPSGEWHIQPTYGGHMIAAAATPEQQDIIASLRALTGRNVIVPEDLASGRALPLLYQAVCARHGTSPKHDSPAALLAAAKEEEAAATLRLFLEFFGLFAHNAIITANAYDGLYLTGGLMVRLYQGGLFDIKTFLSQFELPVAPAVRQALAATPIYLIEEPNAALYGLAAYLNEKSL